MLSPLPRHRDWEHCLAHSPGPVSLPRKGGRVGLCNVLFEDCSAFTRVTACTLAKSPNVTLYIRGFSHFVSSMTAPIASDWSNIAGWDLQPLENAAFARRTPTVVVPGRNANSENATEPAVQEIKKNGPKAAVIFVSIVLIRYEANMFKKGMS
jgi:hypothetical protein